MPIHLAQLMSALKNRVAHMSLMVQEVVEQAVDAVLRADARLAQEVMTLDRQIDAEEVLVEKSAIDILALHQPAASDLRWLTSVIKVNSDLERIGDCAVNSAQRVLPLSRQPGYEPLPDLRLMGTTIISTLRDTIKCFNLLDVELAQRVLRGDDVIDALYHQIVQDMLATLETDGQKANLDLSNIMIAKNFERIADHCTNIAEDVVYVHSGKIVRHATSG